MTHPDLQGLPDADADGAHPRACEFGQGGISGGSCERGVGGPAPGGVREGEATGPVMVLREPTGHLWGKSNSLTSWVVTRS